MSSRGSGDWRSPGGVGKHGAWKVAYADFITALMAVFLVMWLVTQKQEVRAAVAGYFRDSGGNSGGRSVLNGGGSSVPSVSQVQATLERAAARIRAAMAQSPEFAKLRDQVEIQVTPEGLRIELVDSAQTGFFASGSARMEPETERLLAAIGKELSQITQGGIIVEGHTDRQPYRQDGYGNWELSTDRANTARRVMQVAGLTDAQLSAVRGFADTRLRVTDDPLDPRNRRVSVVVPLGVEPRILHVRQPVSGNR